MHKSVGGQDAPRRVVAKRKLFRSRVPGDPGGGTVVYTSPRNWRYTTNLAYGA